MRLLQARGQQHPTSPTVGPTLPSDQLIRGPVSKSPSNGLLLKDVSSLNYFTCLPPESTTSHGHCPGRAWFALGLMGLRSRGLEEYSRKEGEQLGMYTHELVTSKGPWALVLLRLS